MQSAAPGPDSGWIRSGPNKKSGGGTSISVPRSTMHPFSLICSKMAKQWYHGSDGPGFITGRHVHDAERFVGCLGEKLRAQCGVVSADREQSADIECLRR